MPRDCRKQAYERYKFDSRHRQRAAQLRDLLRERWKQANRLRRSKHSLNKQQEETHDRQ